MLKSLRKYLFALIVLFGALITYTSNIIPNGLWGPGRQENVVYLPPAVEKNENRLIVAEKNIGDRYNPLLATTSGEERVCELVFDGLVDINAQGELIPELAAFWEVSDDAKTYTFHLKEGIYFHDGTPLTTEDVAFTYLFLASPYYQGPFSDKVMDLEGARAFNQRKSDADEIDGIQILDERTIQFVLDEPNVLKLYDFQFGILPKHIYQVDSWGSFLALNDKPIGSGAFRLVNHTDQSIKLEANEEYYQKPANIDGIEIVKLENYDANSVYYLAEGKLDIASINPNPQNVQRLSSSSQMELISHDSNSYGYMGLNLRDPMFQDVKVRQAMMHGINRAFFVETFYKGYGEVCNAPAPYLTALTIDGLEVYPFDPKQAKALLQEAGWEDLDKDGILEKDGKEFRFTLSTYTDSNYSYNVAALLRSNLKDLGIVMDVEFLSFDELVDRVFFQRDFDAYTLHWVIGPEQQMLGTFDRQSDRVGGYNSVGYQNEKAEKIFLEVLRTVREEEREMLVEQWIRIANQDLPYLFLSYNVEMMGVNNRVENFHPSAYSGWADQAKQMIIKRTGSSVLSLN